VKRIITLFVCLFVLSGLYAQEFGFGGADEESQAEGESGFGFEGADLGAGSIRPFRLSASGEVSGRLLAFNRIFSGAEDFDIKKLGSVSGKLNTALNSSFSMVDLDAFLNLRFDTDKLLDIDEAYVRAGIKTFEAELGLRKLTWGRADSFGPLDVTNPLDYSGLTNMGDILGMKIARPMVHLSLRLGDFSKLEGVFVPWFRAHNFDLYGRWAPVQVSGLASSLIGGLAGSPYAPLIPSLSTWFSNSFNIGDYYRDSYNSLDYAQGGLRFTTTAGPADLGVQYYFGRLFRPAFSVDVQGFLGPILAGGTSPDPSKIGIAYNYFHQIGVDWAQVIAGFNVRAEAGANITSDFSGKDESVYNPALVYSLGFDRDLVWGINVNLQGNGSVRLMHDKIGKNPAVDTEAGKDITSTRITGILSKKFFRDELEIKTTALWGIEDKDFLVIPALVWARNDISLELSAGIFGGDENGELGQYRKNSYVKTLLTWKF
jgi:hypothetical protein